MGRSGRTGTGSSKTTFTWTGRASSSRADGISGRKEPTLIPRVPLSPGEVSALLAALVAVGPFSSATAQNALDKLTSALVPEENRLGTTT